MNFSRLCETICTRFKQRIIILTLLHALERIGIKITPYYLTIESLSPNLQLESKLQPVTYGFLTREEMTLLSEYPDFPAFSKEAEKLKDEDCRCFGMRYKEGIVAYCWSDLHECNSYFKRFKLNPDEAYLFSARTMPKYRGMNLAPVLRYNLYKQLNEIGRTKFYSITEYFNKSALNFKSKLNAKHKNLSLYISIFKIIKFNIKLREYGRRNL